MTLRWHIAYTNPRHEVRVARDLESRGCVAFCPMLTKQTSHARKISDVQVPLFPRYLFLGLDETQFVAPLVRDSANPVLGLVDVLRRATREPVVIPERVVDDLRYAEATGLFDIRPKVIRYKAGDRIVVVSGPFAEFAGRIVAIEGRRRMKVLLDALGLPISVSTDNLRLCA